MKLFSQSSANKMKEINIWTYFKYLHFSLHVPSDLEGNWVLYFHILGFRRGWYVRLQNECKFCWLVPTETCNYLVVYVQPSHRHQQLNLMKLTDHLPELLDSCQFWNTPQHHPLLYSTMSKQWPVFLVQKDFPFLPLQTFCMFKKKKRQYQIIGFSLNSSCMHSESRFEKEEKIILELHFVL